MHGAGNDFILVEATDDTADWPQLTTAMCNRHFGIGADGVLVLLPSETVHFRMRIFNADGSESDVCGNGMRCMVRYFLDTRRRIADFDEICIDTRAGIRKARLVTTGNGKIEIQISMGKPSFGESDIPVKEGRCDIDINNMLSCSIPLFGRELSLHLVSMGNPHAVCFIDTPVDDFPLSEAGPEITENEMFPSGINFEVVNSIDADSMKARVWERGVGETLACGSGACAVTVAARCQGMIENSATIILPGGVLSCEWDGLEEVLLSGPAETVFTGEWNN